MRANCLAALMAMIPLVFAGVAGAELQEIGPFEGEMSDGFETYGMLFAPQLDFLGRQITVSGTTGVPAVFVVPGSTIDGRTVSPHSGFWFMGGGEPVDWIFASPVQMFGAYFATNSGAADAQAEFFDIEDNSIGTPIVTIPGEGGAWEWNGWSSDVPIKRIRVTGNGVNNGFIDYDDVELNLTLPQPVPAVSAWGLNAIALLLLTAGTLVISRERKHKMGGKAA